MTDARHGQQTTLWMQLLLLIAAPLYLSANVFLSFRTPILLDTDQTFFWVYALRMLRGERVYRDFFQFTPPGTDLFYLTLFRLFGPHIWVTNLALILLGTALCLLCFHVANRFMSRGFALLAAAFFLVVIYGARLDATHHWFSVFAALCAARVLMPQRTSISVILAGAFLGLASFFTQTAGAAGLVALLLALTWEHQSSQRPWRTILTQQLQMTAAFIFMWLALSAHFLRSVGWRQLWYLQVTYPSRFVHYGREFLWRDVHGPISIVTQRLFVYCLLACIYPAVLCFCWLNRRTLPYQEKMQLVLLSLLGLFLWLSVITRMNWNRIFGVALPAVILFFWAVARLGKTRRYAAITLGLIVACYAFKQTWPRQHSHYRVASWPAGRAAVSESSYEELSWVMQHTHPGDLFLQAQWLTFYPPLALRSPIYIDSLWSTDLTRPEQVERTIQEVDCARVRYILWLPQLLNIEDYSPEHDHLSPFRTYMENHYTRVHIFSNRDEIWERR